MNTSNKLLLGLLIVVLLAGTVLMVAVKLHSRPRVIDLTAPPAAQEVPAAPQAPKAPEAPEVQE